jgi:hypothetical protein
MVIGPLKESKYMLVIPRKINDQIVIGDITVTVVAIDERAGKVKLEIGSIDADAVRTPDGRRCPADACDALGYSEELEMP